MFSFPTIYSGLPSVLSSPPLTFFLIKKSPLSREPLFILNDDP
jgi:hypothetical protein